MTRTAYFDLAHGISGDMAIAALVAAGRALGTGVEGRVREAVASLDLGCSIDFLDDERGGMACLRAEIKTDDTIHPPARLRTAIEAAEIGERARERALAGLDVLVAAEARVHGTAQDEVHLHELGSADTAADLAGAAAALEALRIDRVVAGAVPVPYGWIDSDHGRLPLPAPVTLAILEGALLRGVDEDGELVTPTGAAILIAAPATFGPLPEMTLLTTGVAGGGRITQTPNISRVLVGDQPASGARLEEVVLLEANIDDQTPEGIAHAVRRLLDAGALDAWVSPITMKKSRAAVTLSVLAHPAEEQRLLDIVFRQTTTIGARRTTTTRWCLGRELVVVRVHGEPVEVKIARLGDEVVNVAPEADACARVADQTGRSFDEVHADAVRLARSTLKA